MAYKKAPTPSKLELVSHCAAAFKRSLPFPFVENEFSRRGKDLHQRMEVLLLADSDGFDGVVEDLDEKDKDALKMCLEVARILKPKGKHRTFIEQKLDLAFLGMTTGGTPDYGFYDEASGTVTVIDWKFGRGMVPDPIENKQLIAYLLGIEKLLKSLGLEVKRGFLVVVQPNGSSAPESYREAIIDRKDFLYWEKSIQVWVKEALTENPVATPGPFCTACFCEAGKQGACPEFAEFKAGKEAVKEEQRDNAARSAVAGFKAIEISGPAPSFPVIVLSEEAVQKATDYLSSVQSLKVTDQFTADRAGLLLGEITKFEGQVDRNRKLVKDPFLAMGKLIDEAAKRALDPLDQAKSGLKSNLDSWVRAENDRRLKASKEQEETRRRAEMDRIKAEQERAELDRKMKEAQSNKEFDRLRKEKEDADRRIAEAQQQEQAPAVSTAPAKVAGTKGKMVPILKVIDFKAMPDEYKMVNEDILEVAAKSNKWTAEDHPAWLTVEWVEKLSSTGRK